MSVGVISRGKIRFFHWSFVLASALAAVVFIISASPSAQAATTVPTKMNFQGRLANSAGNILADGTYNMKFRIYNASSGGTLQWNEDRLVSASQGVTVTNGQFSVQLGSVTSLPASIFTSSSLYFEVELPTPATATSSSPSWTEGAMTPRSQLATSAYAYNAETLDGIDGAAFSQLSTNNTFTGTNVFNGSTFSIGGSANTAKFNVDNLFNVDSSNSIVSIGAADATGTVLVLDTKNTAGDPTGTNGAMYYNSNTKSFRCYQDGEWRACIGGLVASSTSAQTISGTASTDWTKNYTIPADNCVPGRVYRITARGLYSAGLTGGNVTVQVLAGTTTLLNSTVALAGSANNRQWVMDADVICQTTGVSGSVEAAGTFTRFNGAAANTVTEMSNTAAITLDTTVSQILKVNSQANTAGTTFVVRQVIIESLGP